VATLGHLLLQFVNMKIGILGLRLGVNDGLTFDGAPNLHRIWGRTNLGGHLHISR
jgi:hypothetical protein